MLLREGGEGRYAQSYPSGSSPPFIFCGRYRFFHYFSSSFFTLRVSPRDRGGGGGGKKEKGGGGGVALVALVPSSLMEVYTLRYRPEKKKEGKRGRRRGGKPVVGTTLKIFQIASPSGWTGVQPRTRIKGEKEREGKGEGGRNLLQASSDGSVSLRKGRCAVLLSIHSRHETIV